MYRNALEAAPLDFALREQRHHIDSWHLWSSVLTKLWDDVASKLTSEEMDLRLEREELCDRLCVQEATKTWPAAWTSALSPCLDGVADVVCLVRAFLLTTEAA